MTTEFVLHGVPRGHDTWGTRGDNYYDSFYGDKEIYKNAKTILVVEIRKKNGIWCSYYTYIKPQNVTAAEGRTGSYFGMTLCVEEFYCTDVYSLYRLFDEICNKKIFGTIIGKSGASDRYMVTSFSEKDTFLRDLSQIVSSNIRTEFSGDFERLDSSVIKDKATVVCYYNLDEVDSPNFFAATKRFGKILISREYPSKVVQIQNLHISDQKYQEQIRNYESQIIILNERNSVIPGLREKVQRLESKRDEAEAERKRLCSEKEQLKNQNAELRKKCSLLQDEVSRYKEQNTISETAEKLEPSLNELLSLLRRLRPCNTQGDAESSAKPVEEHSRGSRKTWKHIGTRFQPTSRLTVLIISSLVVLLLCAAGGIFLACRYHAGHKAELQSAGTEIQNQVSAKPTDSTQQIHLMKIQRARIQLTSNFVLIDLRLLCSSVNNQ